MLCAGKVPNVGCDSVRGLRSITKSYCRADAKNPSWLVLCEFVIMQQDGN